MTKAILEADGEDVGDRQSLCSIHHSAVRSSKPARFVDGAA